MKALALAAPAAVLLALFACSSNDSSGGGGPAPDAGPDSAPACPNPGGPVPSATADTHCGSNVVTVNFNACQQQDDAGMDDQGDGGSDYGDTLSNNEGDDDDCKYHVKWTSTPICENSDEYFTVTATTKADGRPLKDDAPVRLELRLGDTHPPPNTTQVVSPLGNGVFKVGPVRFDQAGQWLVRFHFYENYCDTEDSPHGHAAFYLNVP